MPFTTSATFTDGNAAATPVSDFANTTITWGDGTTSTTGSSPNPVVISGSGGTFTVTGTRAYGANTVDDPGGAEPDPVSFNIVDAGGSTTTVTSNHVVVADSVTVCSGATCTGTVNPTHTQPVSATVGTYVNGRSARAASSCCPRIPIRGTSGELNCGDSFLHAPSVLSESNTFSAPQGTISSTVSFPAADGVVLNPPAPGASGESTAFWICFQATQSFIDVSGHRPRKGPTRVARRCTRGSSPCATRWPTRLDPDRVSTTVSEAGIEVENNSESGVIDFKQLVSFRKI